MSAYGAGCGNGSGGRTRSRGASSITVEGVEAGMEGRGVPSYVLDVDFYEAAGGVNS